MALAEKSCSLKYAANFSRNAVKTGQHFCMIYFMLASLCIAQFVGEIDTLRRVY
jgi:hypothetical protein